MSCKVCPHERKIIPIPISSSNRRQFMSSGPKPKKSRHQRSCQFSPTITAQAHKCCDGVPEFKDDALCPILDQMHHLCSSTDFAFAGLISKNKSHRQDVEGLTCETCWPMIQDEFGKMVHCDVWISKAPPGQFIDDFLTTCGPAKATQKFVMLVEEAKKQNVVRLELQCGDCSHQSEETGRQPHLCNCFNAPFDGLTSGRLNFCSWMTLKGTEQCLAAKVEPATHIRSSEPKHWACGTCCGSSCLTPKRTRPRMLMASTLHRCSFLVPIIAGFNFSINLVLQSTVWELETGQNSSRSSVNTLWLTAQQLISA